MFKDTGGIDAASILLNLTDYRVITATHDLHGRQVLIEPVATEAAPNRAKWLSSPGFCRDSLTCFPKQPQRPSASVRSTADAREPATCIRVPNAAAGSCASQPIWRSRP